MAQQAEAGDIGQGMHAGQQRQPGAFCIQPGHQAQGRFHMFLQGDSPFYPGAYEANAQGLCKEQVITFLNAVVPANQFLVNDARHGQAENRFRYADAVSTGQGDPGLRANGTCSFNHLPRHRSRQFLQRPAQDGDGHQGRSTHGVNVRDSVSGSDPSKIIRVVHNGGKEIGGADDGFPAANVVYSRIVAGLVPHQQLWELNGTFAKVRFCGTLVARTFIQARHIGTLLTCRVALAFQVLFRPPGQAFLQYLAELGGGDFAAASGSRAKLCQTYRFHSSSCVFPIGNCMLCRNKPGRFAGLF
ncbi:MAG: hypothetical protein BWX52_01914 [Bacteroidetes bacterium ADurb.Bin013]|nr:MAG: hypothetical protein BWX52_01914 [Bacteroidetes bacterium ADurb.Bin013]